jgi:Tol biopolymer transport system component
MAFARRNKGAYNVYVKASTGAGPEELLVADTVNLFPESWSPDGRVLLYSRNQDLWTLPMFGERKPLPFLATSTIEWEGQFSPDGRWVAYTTFESGRYEVYVTPFVHSNGLSSASTPRDRWLVSTGSGHAARWRRDGREIFYWSPDTKKLMAVPVRAEGRRLVVGRAEPLFSARPRLESYPFTFYDVSADGQRFLINGADTQGGSAALNLIVNWPALLNR